MVGANNGLVIDSSISLEVTLEQEEGEDIRKKDGCGRLRVSFPGDDVLAGISFALKLCHLDADLISMLTGATVITSAGDAVGFKLPSIGEVTGPVCLEGWSKAIDVDHQIVDATTSPDATWFHWVFPYNTWVQDAWTLEDSDLEVDIKGKGRENPQMPTDGPYNDWPAWAVAAGGVTELGGVFYDVEPPTADCSRITVPAIGS